MSRIVNWKVADAEVEVMPPHPILDATPRLQPVSFEASPAGLSVRARVGMRGFHDCPPHGPLGLDTEIDVPVVGGALVFGDIVRGGNLSVSVEGVTNDCPVSASAGASIRSTNPPRTEIQAALPHDTLRRIACKESGQRQFNAPADGGVGFCPLFGPGGRTGVMQLPDPTPDEVWNWRTNVEGGIRRFEEKVAEAAAYPGRVRSSAAFENLVVQFNAGRQQEGLPALTVTLPDFATGNFDNDLQELELDAVRGYSPAQTEPELSAREACVVPAMYSSIKLSISRSEPSSPSRAWTPSPHLFTCCFRRGSGPLDAPQQDLEVHADPSIDLLHSCAAWCHVKRLDTLAKRVNFSQFSLHVRLEEGCPGTRRYRTTTCL